MSLALQARDGNRARQDCHRNLAWLVLLPVGLVAEKDVSNRRQRVIVSRTRRLLLQRTAMLTRDLNTVIQHLRTAILEHDGAGMTDGQLLDCFISRREEAALEALVHRLAPMVWGVCRRLLHDHHDA